jgi:hypothetical protein
MIAAGGAPARRELATRRKLVSSHAPTVQYCYTPFATLAMTFPAFISCLLVLPSALVAIIASLRRTPRWILMLSFSLAAAAAAVTESYYTVMVLQRFDAKFRHAPEAALELALFGDAIIAGLGQLLFGGALALSKRKGFYSMSLGVTVSAILGATFVIMPDVIYAYIRTSGDILRAWIVLFPIISARLTLLAIRRNGSTQVLGHE